MKMWTTGIGTWPGPCAYINTSLFYRARHTTGPPGTLEDQRWWLCGFHLLVHGKRNEIRMGDANGSRQRRRYSKVGLKLEGGTEAMPLEEDHEMRISENLKDYMCQFDNHGIGDNTLIFESPGPNLGGGPRWFSPLDCSPSPSGSSCNNGQTFLKPNSKPEPKPILLYLPGCVFTPLIFNYSIHLFLHFLICIHFLLYMQGLMALGLDL